MNVAGVWLRLLIVVIVFVWMLLTTWLPQLTSASFPGSATEVPGSSASYRTSENTMDDH
jgi:hypothetical protein